MGTQHNGTLYVHCLSYDVLFYTERWLEDICIRNHWSCSYGFI